MSSLSITPSLSASWSAINPAKAISSSLVLGKKKLGKPSWSVSTLAIAMPLKSSREATQVGHAYVKLS
ncbi:hypothetical protein P4S68_14770 [Pseudoalteromonas sp. Hal099]